MNSNAPDIRLLIHDLSGAGSERVCVRLANRWVQEGKDVELWLVRQQGTYLQALDPRVRVATANVTRVRYAIVWLARKFQTAPSCPILVFGVDPGVLTGLLRHLGLAKVPLIYREPSLPESNVSPASWWRYRRFIAALDGIIAQTDFAANQLRRVGCIGKPIRSIGNPVTVLPPQPDRRTLGGQPVLLGVGRLSTEKRPHRLIGALAELRHRWPGATLWIAGRGPLQAELETYVGQRGLGAAVRFWGFVPDIERLYTEADVFIMTSSHEGMPNALLEAILCGCRAVASGGGGVQELLTRIGLPECYLAETEGPAAFAMQIDAVLAMPTERWRDARSRLAALTDEATVAEAYYAFCHEVARRVCRGGPC